MWGSCLLKLDSHCVVRIPKVAKICDFWWHKVDIEMTPEQVYYLILESFI